MKSVFFLLCLLFTCSILAQSGNPPARISKRWLEGQDSTIQSELLNDGRFKTAASMEKGFGLHLMPFSFINVLPRLRLGVQFKSNRFSYLLDIEYGFDGSAELPNDLGKRDYRFFGIRPELRYAIGRYSRNLYLGLEVPVTFMERNINGDFTSDAGDIVFVDVARQKRFRMSAIGKFGIQRLIGDHFYFDAYTGLGIYFRDVEYTNRVGERLDDEFFVDDFGFFGPIPEGKRWLPELALGIRVGWWF